MTKKWNLRCEECNFAVVKREELKIHVLAGHRTGYYQCDKCDFAAIRREVLKSHVDAVHRDGSY